MDDDNEDEEGGNEGLEDEDDDNVDNDDDNSNNDYEDEDGGQGGGKSLTEWKTLLEIDALESLWVQETAPGGTQWEMIQDLTLVQGMYSCLRLMHSDF